MQVYLHAADRHKICHGTMQGAPVNDAIAEANNLLLEVDAVV